MVEIHLKVQDALFTPQQRKAVRKFTHLAPKAFNMEVYYDNAKGSAMPLLDLTSVSAGT